MEKKQGKKVALVFRRVVVAHNDTQHMLSTINKNVNKVVKFHKNDVAVIKNIWM